MTTEALGHEELLPESCPRGSVPRDDTWAMWASIRSGAAYRSQKLSGGDHSALGDALATLRLIKEMVTAG